jgi:hypothetical protein
VTVVTVRGVDVYRRFGNTKPMPTSLTVTGHSAINYARAAGVPVCKYSDPVQDARENLPVDVAREIAKSDPDLVYVEIDATRVRALRDEANDAGDDGMAQSCNDALDGDKWAARAVADALAQALDAETGD